MKNSSINKIEITNRALGNDSFVIDKKSPLTVQERQILDEIVLNYAMTNKDINSLEIATRVLESGFIMSVNKLTIRQIAEFEGVSKSTSHKDLTERLPELNSELAKEVREVININKKERAERGGEVTRQKYIVLKNNR